MSSGPVIDFQISNAANLEKIERFMNASAYRENIEYSSNFNTRLCHERQLRVPFFDPQTNVAQNHCSLYMTKRQRMPGFKNGQIYSYPATRWRKHRRQYLTKMLRPFSSIGSTITPAAHSNGSASTFHHHVHRRLDYGLNDIEADLNGTAFFEENSSLGGMGDDDSKDSQHIKEELPKEWFYDEYTSEIDNLEEPKSPVDDEYDYDPRYGSKKRRRRRQANPKLQRAVHHTIGEGLRKPRQSGNGVSRRGRRRATGTEKSSNAREPSPPSFETAAAAATSIKQSGDDTYRKYL